MAIPTALTYTYNIRIKKSSENVTGDSLRDRLRQYDNAEQDCECRGRQQFDSVLGSVRSTMGANDPRRRDPLLSRAGHS